MHPALHVKMLTMACITLNMNLQKKFCCAIMGLFTDDPDAQPQDGFGASLQL